MVLFQKRVLFVDDDQRVHKYTRLVGQGFESFYAFSPKQAWQTIENLKGNIDLVVSDINMPAGKPTGISFVLELKKLFPKISVLMHSDGFENLEFLSKKGFEFVQKKYDKSDEFRLRLKIKEMLE